MSLSLHRYFHFPDVFLIFFVSIQTCSGCEGILTEEEIVPGRLEERKDGRRYKVRLRKQKRDLPSDFATLVERVETPGTRTKPRKPPRPQQDALPVFFLLLPFSFLPSGDEDFIVGSQSMFVQTVPGLPPP